MANHVDIHFGLAIKGKASAGFRDDGREAYRIRVHFESVTRVVPIKFARRRDAEQGLKALQKLMTFEGTYDEVRARILDVGIQRIQRAVCEAQAW